MLFRKFPQKKICLNVRSLSNVALKYWNGRGLMEVPRVLLAIAGKFPGQYVDGRFSAPEGDLAANLGRMPLLTVDGGSVGQSAAINFYIASTNNLLGSNPLEAAQIIAIAEHLKELKTEFSKIVPPDTPPSPEVLSRWFTEGASDVTGPAVRADKATRYATWWTGRIEAALHSGGFAVGHSLSLADVLLHNTFAEVLREEEVYDGAVVPKWKREPFGDKVATGKLLARHPKIAASVAAVTSNANVQKWLAIRGKQNF